MFKDLIGSMCVSGRSQTKRSLSVALSILSLGALLQVAAGSPPSEGLLLWLDAGDLDADGTIDGGESNTPVAQWSDKSGTGNHVFQLSHVRQPTIQPEAFDTRPAVRFHGDDWLGRESFQGLATGDQGFHVLMAMKALPNPMQPSQRLLDLNSRNSGESDFPKRRGFWVGYQQGRGKVRLGIQNGDEGEALSNVWNAKPNLIETIYAGEQGFAIYVNGRREQRGAFNGTHFLGFENVVSIALGQHFDLDDSKKTYYEGDLAEVLIYNRPLTASERNEIGSYLSTKYSISTNTGSIPHFEQDVLPILASRCLGCHGEDKQKADLDLRTVSSMLLGGKAGPVIVRGFPDRSELISRVESGEMPPEDRDPLAQEEIQRLRDWIEADAPTSEIVTATAKAPPLTKGQREHWAYQRLVHSPPPKVDRSDRMRNPMDAFILAKLEAKGLTFSEPADRLTLIRRLFYDLIGLPPSPEAIDEFLSGPELSAYERLVDGLLQSPHFGERWGRHWLDVAGYVDVYGSDENAEPIKPLVGKWRYRDYVIRSFNDDKPFDRFIVEQLAGDELYDWRSAERFTEEMIEALIATGFLLCANDDSDQNELNTPDIRHHVVQRTTEVVANNLLAMTWQCAKCHDHKYEAISQIDYYSLLANFAPAFNVRHWVVSTGHGRADVSDAEKTEIDRWNAPIDHKIERLDQKASEINDPYRKRLLSDRLATVSESKRDALREVIKTPPDQRNDSQKKLAKEHESLLAVGPEDIRAILADSDRADLAAIETQRTELNSSRRRYDTIQVVHEPNRPPSTHVLRRGNYLQPGLEVQPGLPNILRETVASQSREGGIPLPPHADQFGAKDGSAEPQGRSSGRRLALARQLTNVDALAGQHVARVIVNRLWQQLFTRGIVETSDNFGVSGSRPTHPELLDWLTHEFLQNGWRVKPLIKTMVMSGVYQQRSATGAHSRDAERIDPANYLLWRMNLRRLDSEAVRDAILTASGKLDRGLHGPFVPLHVRSDGKVVIATNDLATPTTQWRRSIYVLARRNYHLSMLRLFDQPIVARNCTVRKPSTVVTQSLALLHDDFVLEQAEYFARRVAIESPSDRSDDLFATAVRIAFGRLPTEKELQWCQELFVSQKERFQEGGSSERKAAHQAMSQLCKMLLNASEFLYVQ